MTDYHFLRDHCDHLEVKAHLILDDVRDGLNHSAQMVAWALRILGERA